MTVMEDEYHLKPLRNKHSANHIDDSRTRVRPTKESDGCMTCLRGVLHCYNVFILIVGCGCLAVGIYLLVTEYSSREITVLIGSNLMEISTYALIAAGGFVALLAFCGCCGTMREDKCVLAFYGIVLCFMLLVLVGGFSLAIIFKQKISIDIKKHFETTIKDEYGVNTRTNAHNRLVTEAWDSMQRELHCCGVHGNISSNWSWAMFKLHSKWYHTPGKPKVPMVPESCCGDGDKGVCVGSKVLKGPPSYGPPLMADHERNPVLYTDGCYDKAVDYLKRNSLIIIGVSGILPVFFLVGSIIAFCLCSRIKKDSDDDEEDV